MNQRRLDVVHVVHVKRHGVRRTLQLNLFADLHELVDHQLPRLLHQLIDVVVRQPFGGDFW